MLTHCFSDRLRLSLRELRHRIYRSQPQPCVRERGKTTALMRRQMIPPPFPASAYMPLPPVESSRQYEQGRSDARVQLRPESILAPYLHWSAQITKHRGRQLVQNWAKFPICRVNLAPESGPAVGPSLLLLFRDPPKGETRVRAPVT